MLSSHLPPSTSLVLNRPQRMVLSPRTSSPLPPLICEPPEPMPPRLAKLPTAVFCGLVLPFWPFQAGLPAKVSVRRFSTLWLARKLSRAAWAPAMSVRSNPCRVTVAAPAPLARPAVTMAVNKAARNAPLTRACTLVSMEKSPQTPSAKLFWRQVEVNLNLTGSKRPLKRREASGPVLRLFLGGCGRGRFHPFPDDLATWLTRS